MNEALNELITSYQELNSTSVDELPNEPTPLEFMRYVAINRPFVVRNCLSHWPAIQKWNFNHLRKVATEGQHEINVAITPHG